MKIVLKFACRTIPNVLILCVCLTTLPLKSFSQPGRMLFEHFSTNEGLSNGYINSILRDSRGFLWVATGNGLNRFDGINFRKYFYVPGDTTSIPGNATLSVVEDHQGNLWILTLRGICLYNRKLDSFSRKTLVSARESLTNQYVFSGAVDSRGFLWIAATNGIFRFNTAKVTESHSIPADYFELVEEDVDRIYKGKVYNFAEDPEGNIWVASCSNRLFRFDQAKGAFEVMKIDLPEASELSNFNKNMVIDRDGDFFITIERKGFLVWYRKTGLFRFFKSGNSGSGPSGYVLSAVEVADDGKVWIGDRDDLGISIFDKKSQKFTYIQYTADDPYSLNSGKINFIYHDSSGTIWIGSILGLNKFSPGRFTFEKSIGNSLSTEKLSNNNVLCLAESKSGDIWIGTDGGGLNRYNRKTGKIDFWMHKPGDPSSISSNAIISVCEDHEGVLWMGTYNGGLARFKDNRFSAFLPDDSNPYSISAAHTWYVLEDSRYNLWVATLTNGLDLFDRKTNRFYNFVNNPDDSTSLCDNSLVQLFEDSRQNLYITSNQGVSILDLKTVQINGGAPVVKFRKLYHIEGKNSISSDDVTCVAEDKKGNIWFGMNGTGLDKFDVATGRFTNYSIKDSLPGNSVTSIQVDNENDLWLATNNGLARFNPETKETTVYKRDQGLVNLALKGWSVKARNGEMFFCGPNGINSFFPSEIKDLKNPNKPNVIITGLRIFNKQVNVNDRIDGRVVLSENISETRNLTLTYKENFFAFEFVALDFTSPGKNNYAYMMEGLDHEWINCGNKREANYTNLSPGNYVFRVKASNNTGLWNKDGASIRLTILPPWWKTLWFRLLSIITITCIVIYIVSSRFRKLKNQSRILEKMVDQKTAELQEMNNELKDAVATKDKFFSIIAHDIKNPFNVIIGSSEILENDYDELPDEQKKSLIGMISQSSTNLNILLDNLLKWSNSQRGALEFKPERTRLHEFLSGITGMMEPVAASKNIRISMRISQPDLTVIADRQMIDTVVRNLVGNAIKFTGRGGEITVIAEKKDGLARISVADNGMGISKEAMGRLFNIKTSMTTRGTENEKGSGLGLVLVREFVTRNGGTIWAESIPGSGSTFSFTLPLEIEQLKPGTV